MLNRDVFRYATIVKSGLIKFANVDSNNPGGVVSKSSIGDHKGSQTGTDTTATTGLLSNAFDYAYPLLPIAAAALGYARDGVYGAVRAGTASSGALLGLLSSLYSMRNADQSSGYVLPTLWTLLNTAASAYVADLVGRPAAEYYSYKRDRNLMDKLRNKLISEGYDPTSKEMIFDEDIKSIKKKIKPKDRKKKASHIADKDLGLLVKSVISVLED
ncbi:MAG: hypothetical protein QXP01_03925 [Candidatus Hadarchaeum sp.]